MTIAELVKYIAEKEGKKSQVKIGDVREVVAVLSDLLHEIATDGDDGLDQVDMIVAKLRANGKRRHKMKYPRAY
jgi:thymidylate synthase